jgi:hypothetical protein
MNWDALLTHTLTLKSGERLTTLREVARVITSHFEATPRWAVLDRAMEAMMRAAESGGTRRDQRGDTADRVCLAAVVVAVGSRAPHGRQVHHGRRSCARSCSACWPQASLFDLV